MAEGKTYDEIEREYAEIRRQGKEFEGLVPVKARVSKNFTFSFSVRYPPHELIAIEAAAKARGITISEFIRRAAAAAIAGDVSLETGEKAQALQEVRERVRELEKAVKRL
jgi:hypothetical protein